MTNHDDNDEAEARLERAKRLHQEIEDLKAGKTPIDPDRPKSIREQVDERSREHRNDADPQ